MHANERAVLLSDWLARIPAALHVGGCEGESRGRRRRSGPSALSSLSLPVHAQAGGKQAGLRTWGFSLFAPIRVVVVNSSRVQNDDPTPRPAVQAEDGFSPKGTPGVLTWTLASGRGPSL